MACCLVGPDAPSHTPSPHLKQAVELWRASMRQPAPAPPALPAPPQQEQAAAGGGGGRAEAAAVATPEQRQAYEQALKPLLFQARGPTPGTARPSCHQSALSARSLPPPPAPALAGLTLPSRLPEPFCLCRAARCWQTTTFDSRPAARQVREAAAAAVRAAAVGGGWRAAAPAPAAQAPPLASTACAVANAASLAPTCPSVLLTSPPACLPPIPALRLAGPQPCRRGV